MKAIILAAGIGKRLKPFTDNLPKCLIEIGGKTLLERHLAVFNESGIKETFIVVGHKKEEIISRFGKNYFGMKISYIENSAYRTSGSGYSLWLGLKAAQEEILFMDGDLAYEREMLKNFIAREESDVLLVGDDKGVDDEGVKVLVEGEFIREIGKLAGKALPVAGESVGIVRLSQLSQKMLKDKMNEHIQSKDIDFEWEHVLNECLDDLDLGYMNAGKYQWVEIDFEGDVLRAKHILKP